MTTEVTFKIPKTHGACADRLWDVEQEIKVLNRQIDKLQEEDKALKEHLIQSLSKDDASGVHGQKAKAVVQRKTVPTVKDWDAFYKFILKTKDFSLMQRRVSDKAVRDRWDEKEVVPGVDKFNYLKVSVNKI